MVSFSPTHPGVSVVIPTYNGRRLLERFLPSVIETVRTYGQATGAPTEIIVVDDGSRDDTISWLAETYPDDVRRLPQPRNQGFGPTCNAGFQAARHPVVWLLNNDIETTPGALLPLVGHFADPKVFAVGCRAYRLDAAGNHTNEIDGAGRVGELVRGFWKVYRSFDLLPEYDRTAHGPLYTMMASGGYAAFDAAKLKILGGFEVLLAPFYWEDAEICCRAWKRGWTVLYEPESLVHHQSSATIPKEFNPARVNVTATRNRLILHWIHLHDRRFWTMHLVMTALLLAADVLTGKFHYARAFAELWKRRAAVLERRRAERAAAVRSDREILALLDEVASRPGVATYKNNREYRAFLERWAQAEPRPSRTSESPFRQ